MGDKVDASRFISWYVISAFAISILQFLDGVCHFFSWLPQFRLGYSVLEMIWFCVSLAVFFLLPDLRRLSAIFLVYIFIALSMTSLLPVDVNASQYLLPDWFGLVAVLFAISLFVQAKTDWRKFDGV